MTRPRSLLRRWFGRSSPAPEPGPPTPQPPWARALAESLGYRFSDLELLTRALTHSSLPPEDDGAESNERLEYLGDAVLGLVVAEELHESWDLAEGEMSKVRAALVNRDALAAVARAVGLPDHLRLGRGEQAAGGSTKAPILADAMEAVIGAAYLDGGLDAAREIIMRHWASMIDDRATAPGRRDYKTRLQEVLARSGRKPQYRVTGSGPDHQRTYVAEVEIGGAVAGRGTGPSKKAAEQEAARRAMETALDADA